MSTATVTSKGQVTIPKEIREKLNLQSGDKIKFLTDDQGRVSIFPATKSVTILKGMVPKQKAPVTVDEMNKTVKARGGRVGRN